MLTIFCIHRKIALRTKILKIDLIIIFVETICVYKIDEIKLNLFSLCYRKLSFLFGGVSTVIFIFFMFIDEDIAHIEHIFQVVSILTLLAIVAR